MSDTKLIQIEMSSALFEQLDREAKNLHLSLSAYILYLRTRLEVGTDAQELDASVQEVFGKYGDLMRRLAK